MSENSDLPVIVVGAGPTGLVAAAHLIDRGISPIVLEAGESIAANIRQWAHVQLFSPWRHLVDPMAERMLAPTGWQRPDDDRHPTGGELIELFLRPLAELPDIAQTLRFDHRVSHVARHGIDKVTTDERASYPFVAVADRPAGEVRIVAQAVVDASGTWTQPNPLGAGGIPAIGEKEAAAEGIVRYGIPDILGAERARYANSRVAVVGSGHSAQNVIRFLATLAVEEPETTTTWLLRRPSAGQMFGGDQNDQLAARGELGASAEKLVSSGAVDLVTGFRLEQVIDGSGQVYLLSTDGVKIGPFDHVIASTGARPDFHIARELRLDIDPGVESTAALGPLIDPNIHSCGSVPPHGVDELAHPDAGYYPIGIKSYGRAPTFLLATGYEQARSVVAEIAGDHDAARRIELALPETGLCTSTTAPTTTTDCTSDCLPD